ncbi:MAG: CotH kinase family protein, partial [Candidatus Zixiibacteriota bacterium]
MQLKEPDHSRSFGLRRLTSNLPIPLLWSIMAVAGIGLIWLILVQSTHQGMPLDTIVTNYLRGLTAYPEHIRIGVKFGDYQKLAFKREQALESGVLITSQDDFVPAALRLGDSEYRTRIRLKGDWTHDNLEGDKWSFRVILRGDSTLFGMKQFSLHQPKVRNYIYEWIFHQLLRREGIMSLRTLFVEVSLNGKNLGIYALEEHFEKRLIEHNDRREGVILKFDESVRWKDVREFWPEPSPTRLASMEAADIDAFKSNRVMADSGLRVQFMQARNLLEQFRTGELAPGQVFDVRLMASYLALTDLVGGLHALSWHNLRFYYNPLTSRLEPIGFDAMAGQPIVCIIAASQFFGNGLNSFCKRLLDDPEFYALYVSELDRISLPEFLDSFFVEIDEQMNANLDVIYREFPRFDYSPTVFYDNQRVISKSLRPVKCISGYLREHNDDRVVLDLANIQPVSVFVTGASLGQVELVPKGGPVLLRHSTTPEYTSVTFGIASESFIPDSVWSSPLVVYRMLGLDSSRYDPVNPLPRLDTALLRSDLLRSEFSPAGHPAITVEESEGVMTLDTGKVILRSSLVVPAGFLFKVSAGTTIDLLDSSYIVSYSPVALTGRSDKPIRMGSSDGTGQGLVILNADRRSTVENVLFSDLGCPSRGGWQLTGAITFYRSAVSIGSSEFAGIASEDALNIVSSDFMITDCSFKECMSDAFDGDFVVGSITNSHFSDCGNDAIDISGSECSFQDITVIQAGDKGLSVGEGSTVEAIRIVVSDSRIGLACKDSSEVRMSFSDISGCEVGLALYRKKSEFGASAALLDSVRLNSSDVPYLIESGSLLFVDGR